VQKLDLGFSIADGEYPTFSAAPGSLDVVFRTSSNTEKTLRFSGVAAFSWQESDVPLSQDEPWDGACELIHSQLLSVHPTGATMHSVSPRHLRFRFHPWGILDVVCSSYVAAA
jgi:hypothetical protein